MSWVRVFHQIGARATDVATQLYGKGKAKEKFAKGVGGNMTTRLDYKVEELVLEELSKWGSVKVLSEECGSVTFGTPKHAIIVDPVDGSANAQHCIPMFGISLALSDLEMKIGDVKIAYIRNLVTGDEFYASRGEGAWKNGRRIKSSDNKELQMLGVELYPFTKKTLKQSFKVITQGNCTRCFGSVALDLCLLAEGTFDGFIDLRHKLRTLDLAAGKLIVEEAGGVVSDMTGQSLNKYKIGLREHTQVVAAGNAVLHKKILEVCK